MVLLVPSAMNQSTRYTYVPPLEPPPPPSPSHFCRFSQSFHPCSNCFSFLSEGSPPPMTSQCKSKAWTPWLIQTFLQGPSPVQSSCGVNSGHLCHHILCPACLLPPPPPLRAPRALLLTSPAHKSQLSSQFPWESNSTRKTACAQNQEQGGRSEISTWLCFKDCVPFSLLFLFPSKDHPSFLQRVKLFSVSLSTKMLTFHQRKVGKCGLREDE